MELVWEGWRRQDMVRFGVYHKSYDQRVQLADEDKSNVYDFKNHVSTDYFAKFLKSLKQPGDIRSN